MTTPRTRRTIALASTLALSGAVLAAPTLPPAHAATQQQTAGYGLAALATELRADTPPGR